MKLTLPTIFDDNQNPEYPTDCIHSSRYIAQAVIGALIREGLINWSFQPDQTMLHLDKTVCGAVHESIIQVDTVELERASKARYQSQREARRED